MRRSRLVAILLGLAALGGCGGDSGDSVGGDAGRRIESDAARGDVRITVGSKNFTEQRVLGEIYAQALAAAGYRVGTDLDVGDEHAAFAAVREGRIDAYPEYAGTALLSFFGRRPDDIPMDAGRAAAEAARGFARAGLLALPPTPFTSSNEVAVTRETADRLGLETISDLARVDGRMTLYGSPECRRRLDCLRGLRTVYGLRFAAFRAVDVARRHEVLASGEADVSIVFTTDPQIRREGFVLLEDDRGMFPPYNSMLVVRAEVADAAGAGLRETVELVQSGLTDETMQELNARVDLDRREPREVAQEYLRERGHVG